MGIGFGAVQGCPLRAQNLTLGRPQGYFCLEPAASCRELSKPEADRQLIVPDREPGTLQVSTPEGSHDDER